MENASEALLMAGSILLFIIGLSVAMVAFTITKDGIDNVTAYSDRETRYINEYSDENAEEFYLNYYTPLVGTNSSDREVSAVTVYESLFRAMYEDVTIQFVFDDTNDLWLEVRPTDLSSMKKSGFDPNNLNSWKWEAAKESYLSNMFNHSKISGLPSKATIQVKFMEYLITGNEDLCPEVFNSSINVNVTCKNPLMNLLDGKKITQYTGLYTEGEIGNEANAKEIKIITYKVE